MPVQAGIAAEAVPLASPDPDLGGTFQSQTHAAMTRLPSPEGPSHLSEQANAVGSHEVPLGCVLRPVQAATGHKRAVG